MTTARRRLVHSSSSRASKKKSLNLEKEFLGSRPSRAAKQRYKKWLAGWRNKYPKDYEERLHLLAAKHHKWGPAVRRKTAHRKTR
jgi:hypothetical protein